MYKTRIKLSYRMYQNTSTVRKSIISIESTVVCSTAVNKLRTYCENKRDSFDRSLSKGNLYSSIIQILPRTNIHKQIPPLPLYLCIDRSTFQTIARYAWIRRVAQVTTA